MGYLQKRQRYTFLKLKSNFSTMESIQSGILNREHDEPLQAAKIPENISEEERNFKYRWSINSEPQSHEIPNSQNITYIEAVGECEYSTRRIKDQSTGELLSKQDRLNIDEIETIFVNVDGESYVIVLTNNHYELTRIKKLIGEENFDLLDTQHQIESEFFSWLFYKNIKQEQQLNDEIDLTNIEGFTGNIVNEENQFAGTSVQISEMMITKAFITNDYPITSIRLEMQMPNTAVILYLNSVTDNRQIEIAIDRLSSMSEVDDEKIPVIISIYTFLYLIPEMISVYEIAKADYIAHIKSDFLKEIGIEVIKLIMSHNEIDVDELR